MLVSYYS